MAKKKKQAKKRQPFSSPIVVDYGGDGGAFVKTKAGLWKCADCNHCQYVSRKALNRRTRPLCKDCGGVLYPDRPKGRRSQQSDGPPPDRYCEDCGAKLRSGNSNTLCSPCQRNPGWFRKKGTGANSL